MSRRAGSASLLLLGGCALLAGLASLRFSAAPDADPMVAAARAWIGSLQPALREKAVGGMDDPGRKVWGFVPGARTGVSIKEMDAGQREAAHALLASALSDGGLRRVQDIVALETVLRALEGSDHRDPERYWFAVYGEPRADGPWAWRVEGHHLSLRFTVVPGSGEQPRIAHTPSFLGANPATVREGAREGLRVLGPHEDLAFELLRSFDGEQAARVKIADRAPADILLGPARSDLEAREGLPWSGMDAAQRERLSALVQAYAALLRSDLAAAEWRRIQEAGLDDVRFAWAGASEPGQGHYYRIHGPGFVIEFDNVQNGANHIHTVWRDLADDFGADALRRHYAEAHGR